MALAAALGALAGCRAILNPGVGGECFFSATVEVWEDTNGDGVRDSGEEPLPDIQVITLYNGLTERSDQRTSAAGTAAVGAISRSCEWDRYQVMVVAPAGYDFSTAPQVAFSETTDGGTILFGLKPTDQATPTVTPVITATAEEASLTATPTAEATLAATASSPPATETPSPDEGFAGCDVMTRAQAEAILGPLQSDPRAYAEIGEESGVFESCAFDGALNLVYVGMQRWSSPEEASDVFARRTGGGGEPVAGIGDAATWDASSLSLSVLRGTVLLYVTMTLPDGAREQAIQIAQIAVVRIP
jgi:hypothetical protein